MYVLLKVTTYNMQSHSHSPHSSAKPSLSLTCYVHLSCATLHHTLRLVQVLVIISAIDKTKVTNQLKIPSSATPQTLLGLATCINLLIIIMAIKLLINN